MAEFLTTSGTAHHVENIIIDAIGNLTLVSPYLKLSKTLFERLKDASTRGVKIRIVYRKDELKPSEKNSLADLRCDLFFFENLHAKCYINDTKLIITSLNFYEYSMINNKEIGVLYDTSNSADQEIYTKAFEHIKFIEENSNDKPFELTAASNSNSTKPDSKEKKNEKDERPKTKTDKDSGFCIRTGVPIPFDIEKPLSYDAFKKWNEYADPDYAEKFCHFTGEPSNGETSVRQPILKKNWKKAKEKYGL